MVADLSSMALGTDGTSATAADSDITSNEATRQMPLVTVTDRTIILTHIIDTATGNGVTYREGGVFINSDGVLLDRFVFPDFEKTEALSLTTIDVLRID